MGAADIIFEALESRVVRSQIGDVGKRIFKASTERKNTNNDGGFLGWLWESVRLVGFLLQDAAKLITFSFTALWGLFVSAVQFVWNFDWNLTDKSIDQLIKTKWDALGGMLGGTLGNLVGWLGCGVLPGAVIFSFNEPLGAYILANVAEETVDEFIGNVSQLTTYTLQSTLQTLFLWQYKNVRQFIKNNVGWVTEMFGQSWGEAVLAWGNEGSKPWSFAQKTEERIEKISNVFIKNFIEEFLEESWEGCVEAGYVVANSIDSYLAAEKLKQQQIPVNGKIKYLEVTPNRDNKEQRIILAGPQELLKQQVVTTLADYQLMADKDVGVVYNFEPERILSRKHKPQVVLYFQETKEDFANRRKSDKKTSRGEGRISFRLMDKTTESINMDFVTQLANKVKGKFGKPPLQWNKGKLLYSYTDWEKGYQLQLLANSESEALRIIEQVLDIQTHSVDREKIQQVKNLAPEKAYDNTPKSKNILGKLVEPPVKRKELKVSFLYAQLFIEGNLHPITLYDRSKRYRNPIVRDNT
jgi:hypothetical protein